MPNALPSLLLAAALCGPVPASDPELPPVSLDDLILFPSHKLAEQMDDFAIAHCGWLSRRICDLECGRLGLHYLHRLDIERELEWRRQQRHEAGQLQQTWNLLWQAHGGYTREFPTRAGTTCPISRAGRLECLKRLRERIGVTAYYQGIMPPPVPVWLYTRID